MQKFWIELYNLNHHSIDRNETTVVRIAVEAYDYIAAESFAEMYRRATCYDKCDVYENV